MTQRLLAAVVVAGSTLLAGLLPAVTSYAAPLRPEPEKWETRVFAKVPAPGYPAYVFKHRNGRVYAGTYKNSSASGVSSRVHEWAGDGTLLRSWAVPGQVRDGGQGVQVAHQTRDGKLVLLETSTSSVMTLDVTTGRFRRIARLPDLPTCSSGADAPCSPNAQDHPAVPNYATWGPGGALFVTDYRQAVIWKLPPGGREPRVWFSSPRLDGTDFGTTGIWFRPGRRDLLISQQASLGGDSLPTNGFLFRLPIKQSGAPGRLEVLWTSQPGDLPDGFGIGRSGRIYMAQAGLSNQLVELSPSGRELGRFPDAPFTGENGSPIPFDTPCSATFHGRRVLVANQSAVAGDASHQAILTVHVGERGRAPYLPRGALLGGGVSPPRR